MEAALRIAQEFIELTGVNYSDALAAALTDIEATTGLLLAALRQALSKGGKASLEPRPGQLDAEQLAQSVGKTIRETNRRFSACGLQVRNDLDKWQLTESGRNWGHTMPGCAWGHCNQQILWDPLVLTMLKDEER
ncbi:MAG: hypothetical protein WEC00_04755 [Dongiaceae bacterium]